jgi:hypothetical protein
VGGAGVAAGAGLGFGDVPDVVVSTLGVLDVLVGMGDEGLTSVDKAALRPVL